MGYIVVTAFWDENRPYGNLDLSYEPLNYEDKWVAILEPDERIVGSGEDAYEAKLDAERNGYPEVTLLRVRDSDDLSYQREFRLALTRALAGQSIEDGQSHPAEPLLESALLIHGPRAVGWIESLLSEYEKRQPSIAAGLLRCVGRMDQSRTAEWGKPIVIRSFDNPDAEIREAAVRALEHWGGADSVEILRHFAAREPEPWLKSYMQEVVEGLSDPEPL